MPIYAAIHGAVNIDREREGDTHTHAHTHSTFLSLCVPYTRVILPIQFHELIDTM